MARTANALATELAEGLGRAATSEILYPVEANEVFVRLPENTLVSLEAQGFQFYRRGAGVIRLVTGWNTKASDVASFVDSAGKAV
jgi:threonine aldolase